MRRSRWDRLWKWFDDQFGSADREMKRIETAGGKCELIYEDGHVEIRVKGKLKSVTVNGRIITVSPR